ncbi:unnamed protein product [Rotaria magnacalcarata]|uniref:Uncharacterized protein n=1 Tax=Rotaria magnacalcarata TaxID=392030 RepID=A0A819KJ26_9BILA|nr:unnamed protein product [Rotaria magnacalcarata]CAF4020197.1 unnamed protein product [Rotaria magnacalcarata]
MTTKAKNNFTLLSCVPQPLICVNKSLTSMHAVNKPHALYDLTHDSNSRSLSSSSHTTEDDNIDWELVTQQLEANLRTSTDNIRLQSDEHDHINSPSTISKQSKFHPITDHQPTVLEQTSSMMAFQNNDNTTLYSTFSKSIDQTSILRKLYDELLVCQQRQAFLLEQIQQIIKQPQKKSSSLKFFLPLNSLNSKSNDIPSLQDAFQQRKSSFIQQSKERIDRIHRHTMKPHRCMKPNIKSTNNTYLKQRRQNEHDRLCAMIVKHQNRENAKVYGNLIKKSIIS